MTSPYALPTDKPATLFDLNILLMTGALFIHDAIMITIPIPLAIKRDKHGVLRIGKVSRHDVGDTFGFGSTPHAQFARDRMRGLSMRPIARRTLYYIIKCNDILK